MAAIITDQIRILNSKSFLSEITNPDKSYYIFVGLTNPFDYDATWDATPPSPRDSFEQEFDYWDTMISMKRIRNEDVRQVIRRIDWLSGITYDMYRHNIDRNNPAKQTEATSLYSSNYYVINSDYRVYICLQNGTDPENPRGRPSLDEPRFTDLEPRSAGNSGDGYVWKYLYTISPSDVIKFDSTNYMPVPRDWDTNVDVSPIRTNANTSGQLKTVVIKNRGVDLGISNRVYTRVPIKGDGFGAEATIVVNNDSQIESVTISRGGYGYTYASLDLESGNFPINNTVDPVFEVIIPPRGGHGADIYRELGVNTILIYSRFENDNENPDFIIGNEISRIGIVANPKAFQSDSLLTLDKASAVQAIKLAPGYESATFPADSFITQTVGLGSTAVGRVVSFDKTTGVLKIWQDKSLAGFNSDGTANPNSLYGFNLNRFTSTPQPGGSLNIIGSNSTVSINTSFGTLTNPGISTIINNRTYYLGQTFIQGLSNPEVEKRTGDIIYVDNRPPITRSQNQKEDIKVILQF